MRIMFAGGLNENGSQSINEQECAEGQNFELGLNISHFQPRAAFEHYGTAPVTTNITGFMQLVKRDDTETTLVAAGTNVYQLTSAPAFTSVGTITSGSKLRDVYWALDDYLVITDITKTTVVKKWDGTTFSTLTTGLGTDLYAKYGAVHNGRVWLFNVKTTTDTPHLMVASAFEDPTSYDTALRAQDSSFTTGNEAFYMVTPDLRPINGVVVFQNVLIISTERGRLYSLTGDDSTNYAWTPFYQGSAVTGTETMVNMGNDVAFMKEGGSMDLLSATQNFGDVRTDDISRWIPEQVKGLTDGIAVYDQFNQKVYWFVTQPGGSYGKVLVLFKDLMASSVSPWSVYRTAHASLFITSAAKYMRKPGSTDQAVFFGDASGRVFFLPGIVAGDGETLSSISTSRKTKLLEADGITQVLTGEIQYRRLAQVTMDVTVDWGEDYAESTASIILKGPTTESTGAVWSGTGYWSGSSYWSQGFSFAAKPSVRGFSNVGVGKTFTVEVSADTIKDFQVDHLDIAL